MPMSFEDRPDEDEAAPSPAPPKPERAEREVPERAEPPEEAQAEPGDAESATATEPEAKPDPNEGKGRREALAKLTHEANNGEAPEATETPAEEAEVVEEETPAEAKEEEKPQTPEEEVAADTELRKGMKEATAKRFDAILKERGELKERLTKSEPVTKFGEAILSEASKVNMPPAVFKNWSDLGMNFFSGKPETIEILEGMLADAREKDKKARPEAYKMPEHLKKRMDEFSITEETANELWQKEKEIRRESRRPVEQPQQPPVQKTDTFALDKTIAEVNAAGQAKHKTQWAQVEAMAFEKVKAQGQATADVVADRLRRAVTDVEKELAAKAKKASAPPLQSIRPSTRTTGSQPKTGRQSIMAQLTR